MIDSQDNPLLQYIETHGPQIITWLMFVFGWIFLNRKGDIRSSKAEITSQIGICYALIFELIRLGSEYWSQDYEIKSCKPLEISIKAHFADLGVSATSIKREYKSFIKLRHLLFFRPSINDEISNLVINFKRAMTDKTFEDPQRKAEIARLGEMESAATKLREHLSELHSNLG